MAELGIGPEALRLDGQVALVTGASKNIGAAIAASFARAGADVLLVARGQNRLSATAETIRALAPERRIETLAADVADADGIAAHALATFGRVDTLINNALDAGLEEGLDVLAVPDATWERVFAVNLFAPLRLTRALARATTLGCVINLVSGSGLLPNSAPGHLPAPTMAP
jgi:NAD(P)-dependent dehydrogenase (short-subunit alcohol dehydrogenase family)